MIVVPVLMTSCQVLEKWNTGPRIAQRTTTASASMKAFVVPVHRVTRSDNDSISCPNVPAPFRLDMRIQSMQREYQPSSTSEGKITVSASGGGAPRVGKNDWDGPIVRHRAGARRTAWRGHRPRRH